MWGWSWSNASRDKRSLKQGCKGWNSEPQEPADNNWVTKGRINSKSWEPLLKAVAMTSRRGTDAGISLTMVYKPSQCPRFFKTFLSKKRSKDKSICRAELMCLCKLIGKVQLSLHMGWLVPILKKAVLLGFVHKIIAILHHTAMVVYLGWVEINMEWWIPGSGWIRIKVHC